MKRTILLGTSIALVAIFANSSAAAQNQEQDKQDAAVAAPSNVGGDQSPKNSGAVRNSSLKMWLKRENVGASDESTTPKAKKVNNTDASERSQPSPAPATTDPAYVIGAEDVLDVNVWKEPDISRTVPVRPDGKISLPLINDVQAAGMTPSQLATIVTEQLHKFVNDPQVTVIVTTINSQRVFVFGEVTRAGAYPLIPGMTILQALSSAGGFTPFANVKKIHVMRQVNGKSVQLPFNYRDVIKGDKAGENVSLQAGDTVIVP